MKIGELRGHERQIHTAHLLTTEPLERTLTRYFEELDLRLESLDAEIAQGDGRAIERVSFDLVGDVLMRSTVQALFGHDSFADYPHLFGDLRQFLSEHFFERIIGLPDFFARGAVHARERIKKRLAEVVASAKERGDVSEYIRERVGKLGQLGLSVEGVVSNEFDIILGYLSFQCPLYILLRSHSFHLPQSKLTPLLPYKIKPQFNPNSLPHPPPPHQRAFPPLLHLP